MRFISNFAVSFERTQALYQRYSKGIRSAGENSAENRRALDQMARGKKTRMRNWKPFYEPFTRHSSPWRNHSRSYRFSSWYWAWLQYSLHFVRMCSRERNPLREFCSPPFFLYPRAQEALGWLLRIIFLFCPLMQPVAFIWEEQKIILELTKIDVRTNECNEWARSFEPYGEIRTKLTPIVLKF